MTNSSIQQTDAGRNRIQSFAFVIAAGVSVFLSVCFAVPGGAASERTYKNLLESRINPNDATAASLARLPGIGPVRAEAIAAYSERFREHNEGGRVFQNCADLQKVKGIGPRTAQNMCEWLRFE